MGTLHDWLNVLTTGGLWGAGMLLLFIFKRRDLSLDQIFSFWGVLQFAFGGLLFGLVMVFDWRRTFLLPLIVISAPAAIGMVTAAKRFRKSAHRNPDQTTAL